MTRYLKILLFIGLAFWGCEEEVEETPPTEVTLWGEVYSVDNTTGLDLRNNQLTGEIPETICDLNINWNSSSYFRIYNNQFCPPYPSCIEDYVGEQDTSDCP